MEFHGASPPPFAASLFSPVSVTLSPPFGSGARTTRHARSHNSEGHGFDHRPCLQNHSFCKPSLFSLLWLRQQFLARPPPHRCPLIPSLGLGLLELTGKSWRMGGASSLALQGLEPADIAALGWAPDSHMWERYARDPQVQRQRAIARGVLMQPPRPVASAAEVAAPRHY
jgi:hypothetical protein